MHITLQYAKNISLIVVFCLIGFFGPCGEHKFQNVCSVASTLKNSNTNQTKLLLMLKCKTKDDTKYNLVRLQIMLKTFRFCVYLNFNFNYLKEKYISTSDLNMPTPYTYKVHT